jgi:hypothetical protein
MQELGIKITIFIWKIMQIILIKFMMLDSELLFKIMIDQKS